MTRQADGPRQRLPGPSEDITAAKRNVLSIVPQDGGAAGEPVSLREAIRDWWLAESDRRDRELAARLEAFRDGWRACEQEQACAYERGIHDGITGYKKATREIMELARLQIRRYGPESRQFTDPQWSDFPGLFTGPGPDGAA